MDEKWTGKLGFEESKKQGKKTVLGDSALLSGLGFGAWKNQAL